MARRARAGDDKRARRDDLLAAAAQLFASGDGDLPTVDRIAATAGVAKGTVYLYFRTREAIFADLLLHGWNGVLADAAAIFAAATSRAGKVAGFIAGYVDYLGRVPELLRLDALGGAVERNLPPEHLHDFKRQLAGRLAAAGAVVDEHLALPAGRGGQLLMRSYALTRGLWQTFGDDAETPPEGFPLFQVDFTTELVETLTEYWRGALAAPG
ncbi:TetR family transcriptional regulator [Sphingomonas bacterium]|uniref:TetR family transcriptional regulator n=1 Tax=Sphingomonas bacterium TaxID=1895847 RepID=UPI0015772999|nr:TetR family transcriptional regulator [Sphingomonas bacterium]